MDYQGTRFVSLDSPSLGNYPEDSTMVLNWLEKTLAENTNRWTVVFTHYPIYSCSQGRNNERYRNAVQPLLEKYNVDLVLAGHDHTYCRGFNTENIKVKDKNGKNNFKEGSEVAKIRERTEIPESAKDRYSAEELEKYQKKFPEK